MLQNNLVQHLWVNFDLAGWPRLNPTETLAVNPNPLGSVRCCLSGVETRKKTGGRKASLGQSDSSGVA